jgi:hypothetical protein
MAKIQWIDLITRVPKPHLVAALLPEAATDVPRLQLDLLARLLTRLRPQGAYALTINRERGLEIHCGFEREEDACRVGEALKTGPVNADAHWQSRRAFVMDSTAKQSIEAALRETRAIRAPFPAANPKATR